MQIVKRLGNPNVAMGHPTHRRVDRQGKPDDVYAEVLFRTDDVVCYNAFWPFSEFSGAQNSRITVSPKYFDTKFVELA